jgi:hypothetical protein
LNSKRGCDLCARPTLEAGPDLLQEVRQQIMSSNIVCKGKQRDNHGGVHVICQEHGHPPRKASVSFMTAVPVHIKTLAQPDQHLHKMSFSRVQANDEDTNQPRCHNGRVAPHRAIRQVKQTQR